MTTTLMESVLEDIAFEREQQNAKWGEQNHPDGTGGTYPEDAFDYKNENAFAVRHGSLTWDIILLEEVYEALAETDPILLREELIQVAAVAAAWVEAIDRRTS